MAATLALSFDDGPNPDGTSRILALLERHGVTATFFVWGEQAQRYPDVVRATLDAGHSVQPHCWEHVSHWQREPDAIAADIDRILELLAQIGAPRPLLWRPPYGRTLPGASARIAAERGLALAGWTINPHDYAGHAAGDMLADVRAQLVEGERGVLLLHDGHREPGQLERRPDASNTVELVRLLLEAQTPRLEQLREGLSDSLDDKPPPGR